MLWVLLELIAVFLWSVESLICKFCRVKYIENSLGYIILIAPTGVVSLLLLLYEPLMNVSFADIAIIGVTGLIGLTGYYFFVESLHKQEVSRVLILSQTTPLFTLLLSRIFLGEILKPVRYISFLLIMIGAVIISFENQGGKITFNKGATLVIISAFLFSVQDVLFKRMSYLNLTTAMIIREAAYVGAAAMLFLLVRKVRKRTMAVIKDINIKRTSIVYSSELLGITGMFISYLAIQKGPVSLVGVIDSFQPAFVFFLTILLSIFLPKLIHEKIDRKTISIKIVSIVLMLVGLYVMSI